MNRYRQSEEDAEFYVFPGGGQRQAETLHEAPRRECEELGAKAEPLELLFVRKQLNASIQNFNR